jgi:hypothetical protein
MEKNELEMLLKLRDHVIGEHKKVLKESGGQNTAIVSARDAASMLATVVNSLDDILRPHVNFSK